MKSDILSILYKYIKYSGIEITLHCTCNDVCIWNVLLKQSEFCKGNIKESID